ncbi:conjugative relaxase-like TrwC/TraI family protein [Humibacillus xanthopallidus]|uniref:Conjugative relaxase-like TrwC/TraI family protein n=1 Tax=Humibacillus xanthopallidus TaxID=412689 RepID=A0A543PR25_9MICO|nr:MobF family relaxase [Humibacillus xanthopallidus]TQN46531.1 conjugative relaxase-like TrwC/TraI family protein [Humibacillus xanthopallidus]
MSIRRMTLGSGYRYLMASVVRGDADGRTASPLTDYYTQVGTPRGRFLGRGLAGLDAANGVAPGSVVNEEQLWRMLGMLQDPATGAPLGRPPGVSRTAYVDGLGRARKAPMTVAGFDLTFSVPKSVSVAWALADEPTRARVRAAHQAALEFVIGYAEERVFATRTGRGGVVSDDVRGVVAAAFEHWDSRAGDPQLHTHVVVLNRVQAVSDGGWRTLDSKALFRSAVGLSELYNGVLSDLVTADLGYGWAPEARRHSGVEKWEVTGVAEALRSEFSQRSTEIEAAKDVLVEQFVASHGRQPTAREVLQLRQQATLATRPDKHQHRLSELVAGWRKRAVPYLGQEPEAWVASLTNRNDLPLLHAADLSEGILADAALAAVTVVSGKRATFTRANVFAEVLRQIAGVRFAAPAERVTVAERVSDLALGMSLQLTPPDAGVVPDALRRPDGSSRFRARDSKLFTTAELLEAEGRLLAAGRTTDGPAVPVGMVVAAVAQDVPGREHPLSTDQADAVCRVLTSGRVLDVLVGPAGTGKSTAMAGVRAAWEARHGPGSVVGLAPSAAAAEVLADAVGVPTENTAKWLAEASLQAARRAELDQLSAKLDRASPSLRTRALLSRSRTIAADIDRWRLRAGQLVIVDEASMAGTFELDSLTAHARTAGAKVLLVGDWAQLSPVSAGGAFKLLATDRDDTPELLDVRRFRHEWEREASLGLRSGRPSTAAAYVARGRVEGGARESMLDVLFEAWRADTRAGRRSLMMAADAQTVADLNARARADRVATGDVTAHGVLVEDGSTLGIGDVVVTRLNQRTLAASGAWVKNGDQWIVTAIRDDGSVLVRRPVGGGVALLPASYVREHVELGYATTAHRAQGRTVDTAHAFVTATTVREPLYVMATRGRESNRLYIDTRYDPDSETAHEQPLEVPPLDVLTRVLACSGADKSATETRHDEFTNADNPARFVAEGAAAYVVARERRYTNLLLVAGVTPGEIESAKNADLWRPLLARMHHTERLGIHLDTAITPVGAAVGQADGRDRLRLIEARLAQQMSLQVDQKAQGAAVRAPGMGTGWAHG